MAGSTLSAPKGKPYAGDVSLPGGALCLISAIPGRHPGVSGSEWIAGFPELVDWLELRRHSRGARRPGSVRPARHRHVAQPRYGAGRSNFAKPCFRVLKRRRGGKVAREDLSDIEAEHARAVSFARLSWAGEAYRWSLDPSAACSTPRCSPWSNRR